jgi:hypothetical protein
MQGGCYYISSFTDKNIIPQHIELVKNDLKTERWDNAQEDLHHLDLAWKRAVPSLQFHAEMDAIDGIQENLARLSGSIDAQDLGLALAELSELAEHWENLKN